MPWMGFAWSYFHSPEEASNCNPIANEPVPKGTQ